MPRDFTVPTFDKLNGLIDPISHMMQFRHNISHETSNKDLMCKLFVMTLVGSALAWFIQLLTRSVRKFEDLGRKFVEKYYGNMLQEVTMADLLLEQRYDEPLRQYLMRFLDKMNQLENLDSRLETNFFVRGLVSGSYMHEDFLKGHRMTCMKSRVTQKDCSESSKTVRGWPKLLLLLLEFVP